jgi:ribonuclease BN (tRNA processing enzyme)
VASQAVFTITYWGTTGTIAAPIRPSEVTDKVVEVIRHLAERGRLADLSAGPNLEQAVRQRLEEVPFHLRSTFGGNTTCVEVQTPDALLILDCGTGLRELGISLGDRWNASGYTGDRSAHVLISHPHVDHTFGLPFVGLFFDPRNHFTLWESRRVIDSLGAVLCGESPLSATYFPPTFDLLKAIRNVRELHAGQEFMIGSTRIQTFALYHPGGCLAFRLDNGGRSFVFATDHEHQEVPDPSLAAFARGADLLYTDGQYLTEEYEGNAALPGEAPLSRRGWGHSTVEACVATAVAAEVRELHVGHRDPRRSDAGLAAIEAEIRRLLADSLRQAGRPVDSCRTLIPYEGLTVRL